MTLTQLRALLYVLRHGGYAKAEKATGIARTTLYDGVREAEETFRCTFFEARPFRINRFGWIMIDALEACVQQMEAVEDRIARARQPMLRIAASEIAITEYLPDLIAKFEKRHPEVQCETYSGSEADMHAKLARDEVDCAIAPDAPHWKGLSHVPLIEYPLALLCPRSSGITSASELWGRSPIPYCLVLPRSTPTACARFLACLNALGVKWPRRREVSSLQAVPASVRSGGGLGLVLLEAALTAGPEFHALELKHFPPVRICLFWRGRRTRHIATLHELLREAVTTFPQVYRR